MINALSTLNLGDFSFRLQRAATSVPAANLQSLPGLDQLHLSSKAKSLAALSGPLQANPSPALRIYQAIQSVNPDASSTTPPAVGLEDRVRNAFFSSSGDEGFDATLDFDGDGRIDFADLAAVREGATEPAPVRPEQPASVQGLRDAFFSSRGDNFDQRLDLDGDGRVNFADLAALRQRQDAAAAPIAPADDAPAEPLQALRDSFFSAAADDSFDAGADLNGDGRVDFADLAALRQRQDASDGNVLAPRNDDADSPVDRLRQSFFATAADEGFSRGLDLNSDGRVNFADLAKLRAKQDGEPARPVRPAQLDRLNES